MGLLPLLALLLGSPAGLALAEAPAKAKLTLPDGTALLAETARSEQERLAALRDRDRIDPEAGILFTYEDAGDRVFPAEAVKTSLDLLFLDDTGVITSAQAYNPLVDSAGQGRHVLVLAKGSIETRGLQAGQRVAGLARKKANKKQSADRPRYTEETPSPEQVNKDMIESLEKLKGKVPDEMYQAITWQAAEAGQLMMQDPDRDTLDILKQVTGMDFAKLDRLAKDIKAKNPNLTDQEVAQKVAAQMMTDLKMPEPSGKKKP